MASLESWYALEFMIVRISRRTSYRCSTKSLLNAASNSSFEAGFVARKSSTGSTSPRPIKFAQTRFTIVRANIALPGLVSHAANAIRRSSVESSAMLCPSSGVGGSGRANFGCSTSPLAFANTICSPELVPTFTPTRANRFAIW